MNQIEKKFHECFKRTIEVGFIKKYQIMASVITFEYEKYNEEVYFYTDEDTVVFSIKISIENNYGKKNHEYVGYFYPQYEINDSYITDFYMVIDAVELNGLCIEIDGHDWHEKSKDQDQRDKKRDRLIISEGDNIIHFTGSEVYTNCQGCVDETLEIYIRAMVNNIYRYGFEGNYIPRHETKYDKNGKRIYGGR